MAKTLSPKSKELLPSAWRSEYHRQFQSVKAALHSLRLQTADRRKLFGTTPSFKEMQFYFDAIDQAFVALNQQPPEKRQSSPFINSCGRYAKTLDEELELSE